MAVKNRLKEVMDQRGKTRYWLWKNAGLSQNTAYRLYDDDNYIPGGDVMDAVCEALHIQPGEWIQWVPHEGQSPP